jgi:phosphoglycerate kinase
MAYLKMVDVDLSGKKVMIREDLNVPLKNGEITSDMRIQAAIPTIKQALKQNAAVIIISHLGRPTEGVYDDAFSLAPVAERLSELLGQEVMLVAEWLDGVDVQPGQAVLCENVRFNVGEKINDEKLAKAMADLCDVFVMDAFATAHRQEASTYGVAQYAPVACAGLLLDKEVSALQKIMENPERPLVAIIGGAKVSTKLKLLNSIAEVVDCLIVGGGIANTFLAAAGNNVGNSLYEPELINDAKKLLAMAKDDKVTIPLPVDVVTAKEFSADADVTTQDVANVTAEDKILDIGPQTSAKFAEIIKDAKTILWNGPVGAFEIEKFAAGTKAIAQATASSNAYSVAGGGDTIAAIEKYGITDKISYISTGGGAFLTYLENKSLPAVEVLEARSKQGEK